MLKFKDALSRQWHSSKQNKTKLSALIGLLIVTSIVLSITAFSILQKNKPKNNNPLLLSAQGTVTGQDVYPQFPYPTPITFPANPTVQVIRVPASNTPPADSTPTPTPISAGNVSFETITPFVRSQNAYIEVDGNAGAAITLTVTFDSSKTPSITQSGAFQNSGRASFEVSVPDDATTATITAITNTSTIKTSVPVNSKKNH